MNEYYSWHESSWQTLQGLLKRLPHALLLKGKQGIGKFELALNFAQSLLCEHPAEGQFPCGTCNSCRWFKQGAHPDFRLVQPGVLNSEDEEESKAGKKSSREISVEQIRDLADFSNFPSQCGGYRIVLIHPAEAMNHNAANALLKTLEEPTANLLFLLVSHKPQQLLPTILSRCQSHLVPTPTREAGEAWLADQGVQDPAQALAQAGFAPLQALSWFNAGQGREERNILLNSIHQPASLDPIATIEVLQRCESVHVIHCMQQWIHDLVSAKLTGKVHYFPERSDIIGKLVVDIPASSLLQYQRELSVARRAVYHPLNQKLYLESILISYRQLFPA